jgi:hypothetical protein
VIIEDEIANFKTFLEHCSCKGLFGPMFSEFKDGSITMRSVTASGGTLNEVKYTPKSVKIEASLNRAKGALTEYKDGWFWFEPSELLAKLKEFKSGSMVLDFDGVTMDFKCNKARRKTMNIALIGKGYDVMVAHKEAQRFNIEWPSGLLVFNGAQIPCYVPSVAVYTLKGISTTKKAIANANTYFFSVSKDGVFKIVVADSEKKDVEYMNTEIDTIKDVKAEFTTQYLNGFDEVIQVFDGFVDLWFGDGLPLAIKSVITSNDRKHVIIETIIISAPFKEPEKKVEFNDDGSVVEEGEFEEPGEEGEEVNTEE